MKINYQETTSDLATRIDIHYKYGGRDIDQWMLDLLKLQPGMQFWTWAAARASSAFRIMPT